MIQQFHFWVYTEKNSKQGLEQLLHPNIYSSVIHNSQKCPSGCIHKQVVVYTIQWTTIQP